MGPDLQHRKRLRRHWLLVFSQSRGKKDRYLNPGNSEAQLNGLNGDTNSTKTRPFRF